MAALRMSGDTVFSDLLILKTYIAKIKYSASEMTCIVSSGALNSTHSPKIKYTLCKSKQ